MKSGLIGICAAAALTFAGLAYAQETSTTPTAEAAQATIEQAPVAEATPVAPPVADTAPAVIYPEGVSAPPAGKGQIVFFRPNRFVGGALTFTVRENEVDLGRLPNARYFVHTAEPGIHEYEIGRNDTMRMEVEEGQTYYVMQNTQMGIVAGRAVLAPSDEAAYVEALPRMRLWEPRN